MHLTQVLEILYVTRKPHKSNWRAIILFQQFWVTPCKFIRPRVCIETAVTFQLYLFYYSLLFLPFALIHIIIELKPRYFARNYQRSLEKSLYKVINYIVSV